MWTIHAKLMLEKNSVLWSPFGLRKLRNGTKNKIILVPELEQLKTITEANDFGTIIEKESLAADATSQVREFNEQTGVRFYCKL